jgi:hypothetical protein
VTAIRPRTVVVLQPSYLPWLGYFDQIFKSDVFVLYDDVQFDRHGWRNRNRIKTPQGAQWLTVPVLAGGWPPPLIREVRIDARVPWARKHLQALRLNYAKAPAAEPILSALEPLLNRPWTHLLDVNLAVFEAMCRLLRLKRDVRLSSELGIEGERTQRLVAICASLGAERYLTGDAAEGYLEVPQFAARAIDVEYHRYRHPVYQQLHGAFVPYLSVVDLLLNHGDESLNILLNETAGRPVTA